MVEFWLQILVPVWWALQAGVALAKHGEPESGTHNAAPFLVILVALTIAYYLGGFWG